MSSGIRICVVISLCMVWQPLIVADTDVADKETLLNSQEIPAPVNEAMQKLMILNDTALAMPLATQADLKAYCDQCQKIYNSMLELIAAYKPEIKKNDLSNKFERRIEEIQKRITDLDTNISELTSLVEDECAYEQRIRKNKIPVIKARKELDELLEEKRELEMRVNLPTYKQNRLKELNDTLISDAEKKLSEAEVAHKDPKDELKDAKTERELLEKELNAIKKSELVKNSGHYSEIRKKAWDFIKPIIDSLAETFEKLVDDTVQTIVGEEPDCYQLYDNYLEYRIKTRDSQLWPENNGK